MDIMNSWIMVSILVGAVFLYLLIGAFMTIPAEWFMRQINNSCVDIFDDDRWIFIVAWPIITVAGIAGLLGYFPFWLSKKLAEKAFKDKERK